MDSIYELSEQDLPPQMVLEGGLQLENPRTAIRIVFILTRLAAGGPPVQVILLMREMARLGYNISLVTGKLEQSYDKDMSYLLDDSDVVYWVPQLSRSVSPFQDTVAFWHLLRLIRKMRPDIVHTHTAKAGLLGRVSARLAGVPVLVHTFHGNVLNGYFSPVINWCLRFTERQLAKLTDCICVLGTQQIKELCERFQIVPPSKCRITPCGVDLKRFAALPEPLCHRGSLTMGWLGRLAPIKNIQLLLEVIATILDISEQVNFVIAGDGPEKELLETRLSGFPGNRVSYLGWQQDVTTVLKLCDVLMLTSRNEGTPLTLIEGMAAGRPFISTDVGGVQDMVDGVPVISDNGCQWYANAVLAQPNANSFVAAIKTLVANPYLLKTMGTNARRFAFSRYGIKKLVQNLDALYLTLLDEKHNQARLNASDRDIDQKPRIDTLAPNALEISNLALPSDMNSHAK